METTTIWSKTVLVLPLPNFLKSLTHPCWPFSPQTLLPLCPLIHPLYLSPSHILPLYPSSPWPPLPLPHPHLAPPILQFSVQQRRCLPLLRLPQWRCCLGEAISFAVSPFGGMPSSMTTSFGATPSVKAGGGVMVGDVEHGE